MKNTKTKGKNFSCNNTGKRKKSDFYETPYSITSQFLGSYPFDESLQILEPACGDGAIVKVLKKFGFNQIEAYDQEVDFLKETRMFPQMITNPPFSIADEFILKAKQVVSHRFAMLLPLSYLHGKSRYDNIWTDNDFRLKEVHVFTRYPMLGESLREDGKYTTGMMVYAWYLWDKEYKGEPVVKWLDNNSFILSKNDKDMK